MPPRETTVFLSVFGVLSWALCVAYFVTGDGRLDFNGHALGRDFVNYWTAGQLVVDGRVAEIFDPVRFLAAERQLFHPDLPFHFWSYPPPALFLVWPLGFLDYFAALALWTLAGWAVLVPAVRAFLPDDGTRWLMALAPAVAVNVMLGQNGAFTAALLLGGLACLDRRPIVAGLLFGLLVFKPHLGLLLPVAVIASGRWKALVSAAGTAFGVIALSIAAFGVDAWRDFIHLTLPMQTAMMSGGTGPFLWMMPSAFASGRVLGLNGGALLLQVPFLIGAAVLVWLVYRSDRSSPEKAAVAALATFVASPQVFNYDLIPAAAAVLVLLRQPTQAAILGRLVWGLPLIVIPLNALGLPVGPLILAGALVGLPRQPKGQMSPAPAPAS